MYPDSSVYGSWTTTGYQYPSVMTSGPSVDLNNTWSYTSPDDDDISMFCSSSTDATSWSSQATNWTPSVNPSSTHSYPSMALSSTGYSTSGPYQMPLSAYSQPMAPATTNVAGFPPPITRMAYPSTSSPSDYEPSDGGSSSSKHHKSSSSNKSAAKRSEPKRKTTKKDVPSNSSSSGSSTRRKSGKSSAIVTPTHEQIMYDAQLLAQIGPIPSHPLAGGAGGGVVQGSYFPTAEQIGREAWRVCKSEALEMSNRRKLLEHQRTVLEQETENLQFKVGLMREAISKEQRELEEAVTRAERLK